MFANIGTGSARSRRVQPTSYILPVKLSAPAPVELIDYVNALGDVCDVIIVDGSPAHIFHAFSARCAKHVRHVRPDADFSDLLNGKVAGVLTGLRLAAHEHVVIADDDVRYDREGLAAVSAALDFAEVVRPQNYFAPLPWHARVDTARTLINRMTGGDWPGTLGVRRSWLESTRGYDGDVLFENLELVRTVAAAGGREHVPLDLFVRRLPSTAERFLSQRVRQAYDELARPPRMLVWLSILPLLCALTRHRGWKMAAAAGLLGPIAVAEAGRRRNRGASVFPFSASLLAPAWVVERAVSAWLALGLRVALGGVPYHGRLVQRAATPERVLRTRHTDTGEQGEFARVPCNSRDR